MSGGGEAGGLGGGEASRDGEEGGGERGRDG